MAELKIVSGPEAGRTVALEAGTTLRIGRRLPEDALGPGASGLVIEDRRLSRLHCELAEAGGRWTIRDARSSNGTFVNGERVSERALEPGDLLQLGGTVMELTELAAEAEGPAGPEPVAPSEAELAESPEAGGPASAARPRLSRRRPPARRSSLAALAVAVLGVVLAVAVGAKLATSRRGTPAAATPALPSSPAGPIDSVAPAGPAAPPRERPAGGEDRPALVDAPSGELDRVHEQEVEAREIAPAPEEAAAAPGAGRRLLLGRLEAVWEDHTRLAAAGGPEGASAGADGAAWDALRGRVEGLVRDWRREPGYAQHRDLLRQVFAACRARSVVRAPAQGAAPRTAARWALDGDCLKLTYDFASEAQLEDFVPPSGARPRLRREGRTLVFSGEVRILGGEPFEGRIAVRGKVAAGGWSPQAPNINVALFTSARDRLTDDSRRPPSLLNAMRGVGPEPNDVVAFALGYRAAVAEYGGKPIEHLTVPGRTDAVPMPASAVLAVRRGSLLHSDQRECLWAAPAERLPAGELAFEVVLGPGEARWTMNGRPVADLEAPALARIREGSGRIGSVSLFTRASEVRLSSLEVEGTVRREWLEEGRRRGRQEAAEADRAFAELER
ncbi:MAG: FHA domain-containing protein [Planctomycetes bacterium]|nr:FHA domain-containing protein [Planctomycetota bacterium]